MNAYYNYDLNKNIIDEATITRHESYGKDTGRLLLVDMFDDYYVIFDTPSRTTVLVRPSDNVDARKEFDQYVKYNGVAK